MKAVSSALCKFLGCDLGNQEEVDSLNNKIKQKQCELDECIMKSHDLNSKIVDLKFKSDKANEDNAYLRSSLNTIANERDALAVQLGANNERLNSLTLELVELKKQLPVVDPRLIALELKYPPVQTILYKGWNLGGKQVAVPVNDFLTPNSYYVRKLVYESGVPKTEDSETAIPKLRKFYYDNVYSYVSDPKLYGLEERWDLPWELLARYYDEKTKGIGDCEGHSNTLKSIYTSWGLPDWKSRCLCGNVNEGPGHDTNTVFSEVTGKYHHLNCLGKGTNVLTSEGFKSIEDINEGDVVINHEGNFDKVINTAITSNDNKIIFRTSANFDSIICTPEHKFLIVRKPKYTNWKKQELKKDFVYANKMNLRDRIVIPINNYENNFIIDEEFAWLIGHFLGDGNIQWKRRGDKIDFNGIRFITNANDTKLIDKIVRILSKYSTNKITKIKNKDSNAMVIYSYDTKLATKLVSLCGYSNSKHICSDLLFMNKNLQKYILKGFIEADGCFTKHRNVNVIKIAQSLVYSDIIRGILFMLQRLNISYCTYSRWNKNATFNQNAKICGIDIRGLDFETFKQDKLDGALVTYHGDFALASITQLETENNVDDLFYEIEVENSHSYTAEGLACHNSTMGIFYNKISEFPTVDDGYAGNDPICGIKVPWFSYTCEKTYMGTFTTAAEKGFKKKGKKLFEIIY